MSDVFDRLSEKLDKIHDFLTEDLAVKQARLAKYQAEIREHEYEELAMELSRVRRQYEQRPTKAMQERLLQLRNELENFK